MTMSVAVAPASRGKAGIPEQTRILMRSFPSGPRMGRSRSGWSFWPRRWSSKNAT